MAQAALAARQAAVEEPLLLANLDPTIELLYNQAQDKAPRDAPAFQGSYSRLETASVGIVQRTLIGTDVRLAFTNDRLENPALFRVLDPSVDSRLSIDVRQSLLRNFWGRPDKGLRRRARARVRQAQASWSGAAEDVAAAAARAYAELYFAEAFVGVTSSGVASAERLVRVYKEKKRYGLVEASDTAQAAALLETQLAELSLARSRAERSRLTLAAVLQGQTESGAPRYVLEKPAYALPAGISEELVVKAALDRRPEMVAARAALDAAEWNKRIAVLDGLPNLELTGSYGYGGLDRTRRGAWRDLREMDHPVASAGVFFSAPILGRQRRLDRETADLALQAAQRGLEEARQETLRAARDAWENLRHQQERVAARRRLLSLEREKLAAERARFGQGRSSTDVIVRFQQDLVAAEFLALQSEAEALFAQLALGRAAGGLADAFGVSIAP